MKSLLPGPYLRLLRAGTLFSPAADVIAGLCAAGLPWTVDALRAVLASVLLYAAGMVLNDHADRKQDATLRPERPIPAGEISPNTALAFGLGLLLTSMLLAPAPLYYASMALLVVGYDYLFKTIPVLGILSMGSLRALNLLAAPIALSDQALPSSLLILGLAYGLYIVAVTILGIFEDDRHVSARAIVAVQAVPVLVAPLSLLSLPSPWPATGLGILCAALFSSRFRRGRSVWDQAAIRRSMTWLLLGTMLYTSLICMGNQRWLECGAILTAAILARRISRHIALT